jgi:hypothetical protein
MEIEMKEDDSSFIRKTKLEHKIQIEDKKLDNEWVCCSNTKLDKRCLKFFSQVMFGLIIIGFSIYKLSITEECGEQHLYIGLLSPTIGVFLPSPSFK